MAKILLTNIKGPSAYDVAVAEGFVGSEELWLLSLKGQPGDVTPAATAAKVAAEAAASTATAAKNDVQTLAATVDQKVADVPTPAELSATIANEVASTSGLVFYDDFARYPDGPLNGKTPLIGDTNWLASGAAPTVIEGGAAVSSGTGYAWQQAAEQANEWMTEISWAGSGTRQTMTLAVTPTYNSLADLLHFNVLTNGWDLTFRIGGVWSHTPITTPSMAGTWRTPMQADGTRYRVGMKVNGSTVAIYGPNGETFSVALPQVAQLTGKSFFVEPVNRGVGTYAKVHRVMAFSREAAEIEAPALRQDGDAAGWLVDNYERTVGNRYTSWQVAIGRSPATGIPSIEFGPRSIVTTLTEPVAAGATSIKTVTPLTSTLTLILEPGTPNEETVTTSGNAAGTGPYTQTVTATTKEHPVNAIVLCAEVPATRRRIIDYNPVNGAVTFPNNTTVDGTLFIGGGLDTRLERSAAGVVYTGIAGLLRSGRNATASRPNAVAVGAGSQFYDTTLSIPIWSDGAIWKNAAGTAV